MLRIISFVAVLVLGVACVVAYLVISPWMSMPEDSVEVIDARWEKVERWATERTAETTRLHVDGPSEHLEAALRALEGSTVLESLDPQRGLGEDELDASAREALDELVQWSEAGGGLGEDPCLYRPPSMSSFIAPMPTFSLARIAILRAEGPDDPRLTAALRLGADLRLRGGLLFGMIGAKISDEARTQAIAREWTASAAFREHPLSTAPLFGIVAREPYCQFRMIEAAVAEGEGEALESPEGGWRGFIQSHVGIEREMLMMRWYIGRQLEEAHAVADDPAALSEALEMPPSEDMPASLIVRTMMTITSDHVDSYAENAEAYRRFLAGETVVDEDE